MERVIIEEKSTGQKLLATEFNALKNKTNEIVDHINNESQGGGGGTPVDTSGVISVSNKGNVTLGSSKNVNIEPAWDNKNPQGYAGNYGDIALKPGDDIQFCSHHREPKKRDKVVVKNIDDSDNPVKLQMVAGEIELAVGTKNNPKTATRKKNKLTGLDSEEPMFKSGDDKVLDVKILTGTTLEEGTENERDERGYLKVRAQAVDIRCEKHGGIALQPKGYDSDGHMNKIKFEHGGGDGLEFGTFNTEKTSIYTDEYRMKKSGIWKMATRETEASGKDIVDEREGGLQGLPATGALKYKKNNAANNSAKSAADLKTYEPADDFYDFVDTEDPQTTTEAIIKTAAALNNEFIETSLSAKKNLKISASSTYKIIPYELPATGSEQVFVVDKTKSYFKDELKLILSSADKKLSDYIDTKQPFAIDGETGAFRLSGDITPKVGIEAEEEVDIEAKYGDVVVTSGDTIKMEAPEIRLNALNPDKTGGTVNFGATQNVMFINSKLTKGLKVEASATPTKLQQVLQNNTIDTVYWDSNNSIFRVPVKKIYADAAHTIEITPSNYSTYKEKAAYFADGTPLPEDYTCFIAVITEDSGTYTTNIYKLSTKGSSAVLSKNIKGPVGQYTSSAEGVLGSRVSLGTADELTTLEFELANYSGAAGVEAVQPEEFVVVQEIDLSDIFTLINYFKTGAGQASGPWAQL